MNFRKDINGLRAIAVISVVIFHFKEAWLVGGFVGVDVFFVISGYLMTKIIITGINREKFSIIGFYLARAKRIIPALAFLIFVLLIFGWFYLSVVDYSTVARHSISSLGFFSNLYYLSEAGYFDTSSHKKWLLHTWSLSVEWQFYLIYPLVLTVAYKLVSKHAVKHILVSCFIVSLIYCIYLSLVHPNTAFYIFPTRAWEMLAGGIAFVYPATISNFNKKLLELVGLSLIIVSCVFISSADVWPGYLALLPVAGAYLIVFADVKDSIFTGNFVLQKLGKYSYSIYLWHWPIFLVFLHFGLSSDYFLIIGMLISIIAGYFSYVFIEKKSNFTISQFSFFKLATFPPISTTVLLCAICTVIYYNKGLPNRLDHRIHVASNETNNRASFKCETKEHAAEHCILGNSSNIVALVVGDSHSKAIASAVLHSIDSVKEGILLISSPACPFIQGAKIKSNTDCFDSNNTTLELIFTTYNNIPIFVINRTSAYIFGQSNPSRIKKGNNSPLIYFNAQYASVTKDLLLEYQQHYINTMCKLSKRNSIFITNPVPEMLVNVPDFMSHRMLINNDFSDYYVSLEDHLNRHRYSINLIKMTNELCSVNILATEKYMCQNDKCLGSIEGKPLYFDGDHLSEFGNKRLTPMFKKALDRQK